MVVGAQRPYDGAEGGVGAEGGAGAEGDGHAAGAATGPRQPRSVQRPVRGGADDAAPGVDGQRAAPAAPAGQAALPRGTSPRANDADEETEDGRPQSTPPRAVDVDDMTEDGGSRSATTGDDDVVDGTGELTANVGALHLDPSKEDLHRRAAELAAQDTESDRHEALANAWRKIAEMAQREMEVAQREKEEERREKEEALRLVEQLRAGMAQTLEEVWLPGLRRVLPIMPIMAPSEGAKPTQWQKVFTTANMCIHRPDIISAVTLPIDLAHELFDRYQAFQRNGLPSPQDVAFSDSLLLRMSKHYDKEIDRATALQDIFRAEFEAYPNFVIKMEASVGQSGPPTYSRQSSRSRALNAERIGGTPATDTSTSRGPSRTSSRTGRAADGSAETRGGAIQPATMPVAPSSTAGRSSTSSSSGVGRRDMSIYRQGDLICIIEVKHERGIGKADPFLQACLYYQQHIAARQEPSIQPMLLLVVDGAHLLVTGAAYLNGWTLFAPLSSACLFGRQTADEKLQFARVGGAIRLYLKQMLEGDPLPQVVYDGFPQRRSCGGIEVEFVPKERVLKKDAFIYIARVRKVPDNSELQCGDKVVVKFAERYGTEAHLLMAKKGLAPQLYAHEGPPKTLWTMVVMAYVEGATDLQQSQRPGELTTMRGSFQNLLKPLHDAGYVHGDFRLVNILRKEDNGQLLLCDFDWAGKAGEVRYPIDLNQSIDWPKGVVPLGEIAKDHDTEWVNEHCGRQTKHALP